MNVPTQTDYRRFQREERYHYLANFPHRQQSGDQREVNVLVISEVTASSVSMKLRRASVLKGGRQNVMDLKAWKSNRVTRSFVRNTDSTCSEISSVVLSGDTDSSQSDDNILDLSVKDRVRDAKQPPNRLGKEDEMQSQANTSGTVQKISLAPAAMAEDTLEQLRLIRNTSETLESEAESIEDRESVSDDEVLVRSGPSSPNPTVVTARCSECQRLFTRMRRQPSSKTTNRDNNPASLSCDQWVLLKKWNPQRGRHRKKGLLWQSLVHIRKLALQGSDSSFRNTRQSVCSRPHVFQQRNLRRCMYLASIRTDPSLTKAKPRHRKRSRTVDWPPIGSRKPVKRKSSLNSTLSQQLFSPRLSISHTQKGKRQTDECLGLNASSRQDSRVSKQKRNNVHNRFDKQEACDGVEGTRRVLKFDDTPEVVAVETEQQIQGPRLHLESEEICEAQNGVETKDSNGLQEELFEDSDGFKTPTDLFSVKPKITRGNQKHAPASSDTKPALQTANFRALLATMVKNHNKIIKEIQ